MGVCVRGYLCDDVCVGCMSVLCESVLGHLCGSVQVSLCLCWSLLVWLCMFGVVFVRGVVSMGS